MRTVRRIMLAGAALAASMGAFAAPASACAPLTVYFDWNSNRIDPTSRAALERFAVGLAWKGPEVEAVELTSYTDASGSAGVNRDLAWARARAVRDILLANDVPEALIQMEAAAGDHPRVATPAGVREPANRRVELFIQYSAEAQLDALKDGDPIC